MQVIISERPDTFDRVDRVKKVAGQPVLPGDDRLWILGSRLVFRIDNDDYTIPQGFTTDGASIPALAQRLTGWTPWDPPQRWAAIVHDWLYTKPGTIKSLADHVFRAVLDSEGANWWECAAMYWAVRLFAGGAYASDQRSGPMIYV